MLNESRSFTCSPHTSQKHRSLTDFHFKEQLRGDVELFFASCRHTVCKWAFSKVRVQIVEQNTFKSIFLGPSDAWADSLAFLYRVLSISNGGTRRAHLPIFLPVSHLWLSWIKLHISATCHSATHMLAGIKRIIKEKDFSSLFRWSQGGIPLSPLISLSNPSVYVGSLLSPCRECYILIRSILG